MILILIQTVFTVIYQFIVKPNAKTAFIQAWKALTELIYNHESSLGSRLHLTEDGTYLAYAQWPSKEVWKSSGAKLPASSDAIRKQMREACESIEILYQLEVIEDLTRTKVQS